MRGWKGQTGRLAAVETMNPVKGECIRTLRFQGSTREGWKVWTNNNKNNNFSGFHGTHERECFWRKFPSTKTKLCDFFVVVLNEQKGLPGLHIRPTPLPKQKGKVHCDFLLRRHQKWHFLSSKFPWSGPKLFQEKIASVNINLKPKLFREDFGCDRNRLLKKLNVCRVFCYLERKIFNVFVLIPQQERKQCVKTILRRRKDVRHGWLKSIFLPYIGKVMRRNPFYVCASQWHSLVCALEIISATEPQKLWQDPLQIISRRQIRKRAAILLRT